MSGRREVRLGTAQETLLIPLYGRAVETRKKRPLLRDPKAVEMVDSLDYDFSKFDGSRNLGGPVLRGMLFDGWVSEFLHENPGGTVVELGAGLNTRFERHDNGTCHWVDLDLPDSMALRRQFFEPSERRSLVAGSVTEPGWIETVRSHPAPYFFVAEAVLVYLAHPGSEEAIGFIHREFPGSKVAFDTWGKLIVDGQARLDALRQTSARLQWSCDDPRELEVWGLRLLESRDIAHPQPTVRAALPLAYRLLLRFIGRSARAKAYRMNLFTA
jgi:O-methyltransferase involved in polyketide biosynthesis